MIRDERVWTPAQLASLQGLEKDLFNLIAGILSPPVYVAPTLLNSWTNVGGGNASCGYYKDPFGRVHLRGSVTGGTLPGTIFTLPTGYRPSGQIYFPVFSDNGAVQVLARATVTTAGNVLASTGNNTHFSLDGISFFADGT